MSCWMLVEFCRKYFVQLTAALQHMHSRRVMHRGILMWFHCLRLFFMINLDRNTCTCRSVWCEIWNKCFPQQNMHYDCPDPIYPQALDKSLKTCHKIILIKLSLKWMFEPRIKRKEETTPYTSCTWEKVGGHF